MIRAISIGMGWGSPAGEGGGSGEQDPVAEARKAEGASWAAHQIPIPPALTGRDA